MNLNNFVSIIKRDISKQQNWKKDRSKLVTELSPKAIQMKDVTYDPKRVEFRRKRMKCCGR